jgi:hypothetical protein
VYFVTRKLSVSLCVFRRRFMNFPGARAWRERNAVRVEEPPRTAFDRERVGTSWSRNGAVNDRAQVHVYSVKQVACGAIRHILEQVNQAAMALSL